MEATKATKATKAKAEATKKAEAKATKAKSEAMAIFAKVAKAKREKDIDKVANAIEKVKYININDKKIILNKTLAIKNKTLQDIKARYGYDIKATYSYNTNATEYNNVMEALKNCAYIITTREA